MPRYTLYMQAEAAKRQFLEYIEIERGRAVKTVENGEITEQNIRDFRLWLNRQSGSAQRATSSGT